MIEWKDLKSSYQVIVSRAKVPGGWLVLVRGGGADEALGLTFYPDPEHKWDGNSLPQ